MKVHRANVGGGLPPIAAYQATELIRMHTAKNVGAGLLAKAMGWALEGLGRSTYPLFG